MSNQNIELQADLRKLVCVDTNNMNWQSSPSGTVFRKRLHLYGPPEAGQVTSIVQYQPDSEFPVHDHPEGEEILVLEGTFSDHTGDWHAGSYLLNPEGFRHAPYSREGCILFVKLRQYSGRGRAYHALDTNEMPWKDTEQDGVQERLLYRNPAFADETALVRWQPGVSVRQIFPGGAEILILDGDLADAMGDHQPKTWLRLPPGARWEAQTGGGCCFYVKTGGVSYLRSPES